MAVRGIGPKTIDYFKILCGEQDTAAVDMHLTRFLEQAGVRVRLRAGARRDRGGGSGARRFRGLARPQHLDVHEQGGEDLVRLAELWLCPSQRRLWSAET